MKKRKSVKQEMALIKSRATREYKAELFNAVMGKNKFESLGDICDFFNGLSRKAVESQARGMVLRYSAQGFSPREVYKMMEGKNGKI
jgi:hypothetical protein